MKQSAAIIGLCSLLFFSTQRAKAQNQVVSRQTKSTNTSVHSHPTKKGQANPVKSRPNQKPASKPVSSYLDLGLTSGTRWKSANENGLYDYGAAVSQFGYKLPRKEQWQELMKECEWTWTGKGYKVTGVNGKSIILPAAGWRDCEGNVDNVGVYGSYISTEGYLDFNSEDMALSDIYDCYGLSVRLVQGP